MGIDVRVTGTSHNPIIGMLTRLREGLAAGGAVVLAASDAKAPREPEPRHPDIGHMTETGFVLVLPGVDGERVAVGYTAYWARWQHEDMNYHHDHGAAKFLEHALLEEKATVMKMAAEAVRRSA